MTRFDWFVALCIVAIVAAGPVFLIDYAASEKSLVGTGTVVQKSHVDSSSSTGVGVVPDGKSGPIVVVHTTPEIWGAIVKCNGETFSVKIDSNLWGKIQAGDAVDVYEYHGRFLTFGRVIESR